MCHVHASPFTQHGIVPKSVVILRVYGDVNDWLSTHNAAVITDAGLDVLCSPELQTTAGLFCCSFTLW